jgi:hypothetical protein
LDIGDDIVEIARQEIAARAWGSAAREVVAPNSQFIGR